MITTPKLIQVKINFKYVIKLIYPRIKGAIETFRLQNSLIIIFFGNLPAQIFW